MLVFFFSSFCFAVFFKNHRKSAFFTVLHATRPTMESFMPSKTLADMIIGGLAGTGFWLAGLPGDRLKSTFQTDLEGRYKSVPHLTKSVLQEWLILCSVDV